MTTLRQLEYLTTVVDCGSFTRAAELLHVTQPALSHQIRALERSVGGSLLERAPVRPTPVGRALLPHARAALAEAERARVAARRAAALEEGELRLATVYSVTLGVLPPALRAWRAARPGVRIRLAEHRHAAELADAMLAGEADLGVGPAPSGWPGPCHDIGTEEFLLVLPPDDPLAAEPGAVPRHTLADRDWVHYATTNGLAEIVDRACAEAGFVPRVTVRAEQTAAVPQLAAAGLGVALVPAAAVPPGLDAELRRPEPPVRRMLTAFTRGTPDPLAAAFTDVLVRNATPVPDHVQAFAIATGAPGAPGAS